MFAFDLQEAVEHSRTGSAMPWAAIAENCQSMWVVADFDKVRGFDSFQSEACNLAEDRAGNNGGFVVPCEAAAPAGEPGIAADRENLIDQFNFDIDDWAESIDAGDLAGATDQGVIGWRREFRDRLNGGEDGAGFKDGGLQQAGAGPVRFAWRFTRFGSQREFSFEPVAWLLADAIASLAMKGDSLNAPGPIAQSDFKVFVAEQERFCEWRFTFGRKCGRLWGIDRGRFAKPEEATGGSCARRRQELSLSSVASMALSAAGGCQPAGQLRGRSRVKGSGLTRSSPLVVAS
jgi:hypothetical protein